MSNALVARCDCGNVESVTTEQPLLQLCCHCSDCREVTGDDFTTIAFFNSEAIGETGVVVERQFTAASGSQTARELCAECETPMFDRSAGFPTLIGVIAKQISEPFVANPSHHVWTKSRVSPVSVPEGIESVEENLF